jgi:4-hydroxybenzoate polyprenyltransferase/phosphoserine phosphatase
MELTGQKDTIRGRASDARPLVVDLDGTLIRSDLLLESIFALIKRNLLFVFFMPFWLVKGKAHFKHEVATRVNIDAARLPYQEEFLDFLRTEHAAGRCLVLATASNEKFAQAIANELGLFDQVFASDATVNLSGQRKLDRIKECFGEKGFEYAANAKIDAHIWAEAKSAVLVNPERGVKRVAERITTVSQVFDDRGVSPYTTYLAALRLHQWLKNLLVFVPMLLAHQLGDALMVGQALLAFLAFGLCASSVYLLNDLLDLADDRQHPTKRDRPFAAGSLSIINGALLIPCLLVGAFALASLLPLEFVAVLAFYYVSTLAYSLRLKRSALVDVLTLAGLYTIRIIAGAAAISSGLSFWLLAFSMFLFLSMALAKRFTELLMMQQLERETPLGRGYNTTDLESLSQFGSASAYMAVLVLALYINSDEVRDLYTHPDVIWLLCPLLLYLVTRIWLLARRNELHEDPVVYVIRDRRSQFIGVVGAVLLWLAT